MPRSANISYTCTYSPLAFEPMLFLHQFLSRQDWLFISNPALITLASPVESSTPAMAKLQLFSGSLQGKPVFFFKSHWSMYPSQAAIGNLPGGVLAGSQTLDQQLQLFEAVNYGWGHSNRLFWGCSIAYGTVENLLCGVQMKSARQHTNDEKPVWCISRWKTCCTESILPETIPWIFIPWP